VFHQEWDNVSAMMFDPFHFQPKEGGRRWSWFSGPAGVIGYSARPSDRLTKPFPSQQINDLVGGSRRRHFASPQQSLAERLRF
jgi:hypothetical protein